MSCVCQKMDRNRDGVVTIDEFIETCQKVNSLTAWQPLWRGECDSVTLSRSLSYICAISWTGWKYNGLHAALWERHLVRVLLQCCTVLPAGAWHCWSNPPEKLDHLKKKHIYNIFMQTGTCVLFLLSSRSMQKIVQSSQNYLKKEWCIVISHVMAISLCKHCQTSMSAWPTF